MQKVLSGIHPQMDILTIIDLTGREKTYIPENLHNQRSSWAAKLDTELIGTLRKHRSYNTCSINDLLRVLRNKVHHFKEMPTRLQAMFQHMPKGVYLYFHSRFPNLFLHAYKVCQKIYASKSSFSSF